MTMTTFTNGPAKGASLELARSPLFLRVAQSTSGDWDALDLIADTPKLDERIVVYRRAEKPSSVCLDYTDKQGRRRGKIIAWAKYALHDVQPDDATARSNGSWQAWCVEQQKAITATETTP